DNSLIKGPVVTANGGTIDNAAGANILGDAVTLTSTQDIKNRGAAIIKSNSQTTLDARGNVSNTGQSVVVSGKDISIAAGGTVSNLEGAVVSAGRNAVVEANTVLNSGQSLAANATADDVSTITGADVTVKAHGDVRNDAKANLLATGTLNVQTGGSVSNVDANMAGSDVKLQAGTDVVNQSGAIAGDRIHIDAQGSLLNTVKSTITAAAEVVMAAVSGVSNDNSLIKGPVVTANGGTIDNAAGANILGDA
ncbi:hypothetical protein KBJ94_30020, partial [Pseudomonas sp. ITA]|uniref:hypothetical protein n=1 Tax=Pseudomonas sp. ITA TaxID=2825841 RepID=UPI0024984DD8